MAKKESQPYIILPIGRLSFPRLDYPEYFNPEKPQGRKTFQISVLWPKQGTDFSKIEEAIKAAGHAFFGAKLPPKFKNPLYDGDVEKPDVAGYPGHKYLTAKTESRPGLYLPDLKPFTATPEEIAEKFYAGCWVRAKVQPFGFEEGNNQGVAFALGSIQWIKNGEAFGGGDKTANGFEAVDGDDDADFLN